MDSPFSSGNLLADFAGKAETSHCTDNGAFPAVLSVGGICLFAIPMVFTVLTAAVDLMLNLRWPNFSWTRETAVVKQGAAPMLALLINLAYVLVFAGMYLFLWKMEDPYPYLAICLAVTAALTVAALYWLKKKGTRRLEEL